MAMLLQEEGVFANVAVSPAVPEGKALIRRAIWQPTPRSNSTGSLGLREGGKILGLIY